MWLRVLSETRPTCVSGRRPSSTATATAGLALFDLRGLAFTFCAGLRLGWRCASADALSGVRSVGTSALPQKTRRRRRGPGDPRCNVPSKITITRCTCPAADVHSNTVKPALLFGSKNRPISSRLNTRQHVKSRQKRTCEQVTRKHCSHTDETCPPQHTAGGQAGLHADICLVCRDILQPPGIHLR